MTAYDEAIELAKVLERDDCKAIARVLRRIAAQLEQSEAECQRMIDERKADELTTDKARTFTREVLKMI